MSELETQKNTSTSSIIPDWSFLPDELLHIISTHVDTCFDLVHARSVCRSWRSVFPFPSSLLRQSYSLPSYSEYPLESKDLCTLEKVPLFLFRVPTSSTSVSQYFLGHMCPNDSVDHKLLPSSLQCSVKVKILASETLMNMLDCQVFSLGHQYRISGTEERCVAFLPLDKEGKRGEFVVLVSHYQGFLVLTSDEMKWKRLQNVPKSCCSCIVTFRGKFYVTFLPGEIGVIDPYSLEVTLMLLSERLEEEHYLVACVNDELLLVELGSTCRVSRLDEEAGEWVEVKDLGDRVLVLGLLGSVYSSAKELPYGCGLSRNSILRVQYNDISSFKYEVDTESGTEGNLNGRGYSRDKRAMILNKSFQLMAFWL